MTERLDPLTQRNADLAESLWNLWEQGQRPDVHVFLAGAGVVGAEELVAVLRVDQQQRWQAGERVGAESYLDAFPALREDREKALELIYAEFVLRQDRGENPNPDDFLARFPAYAGRLRQQFAFFDALDEGPAQGTIPMRPPDPPRSSPIEAPVDC
jgi:hypothetical protein